VWYSVVTAGELLASTVDEKEQEQKKTNLKMEKPWIFFFGKETTRTKKIQEPKKKRETPKKLLEFFLQASFHND